MSSKNIFWFKEIIDDDIHTVGEKGVKLSQFLKEGVTIPDGFVITSHAFDEFIRDNNLHTKAKHLISTADHKNPISVAQVSNHIKRYFNEGRLSREFKLDLYHAYKKLGNTLKDSHVKIFLSPISNAQSPKYQISYDEVHGEASLIHSIKNCWSMNFSEINLINNHDNFSHVKSLIVQEIINPEKSGKIFTINPNTYDKNTILIKTMLGEFTDQINLVSMPDIYEIDKKDYTIKSVEEVPQLKMKKRTGLDKKILNVSSGSKKNKELKKNEIDELIKQLKLVEKITYFPQEIDWSINKNKIYFTHIKPLTHIN